MKTRPNHAKRRPTRHDPRLHASRLGEAKTHEAVVVTICTPAYAHLREDAVKRFKAYFGLPVQVIEADDKDGYATKLMLDLYCGPQTVIFCDLDWWPVRPIPAQVWQNGSWCAVRDHGHKHPAHQRLPDGSNAHVSQHDERWWERRIKRFFDHVTVWPCPNSRSRFFLRAKSYP